MRIAFAACGVNFGHVGQDSVVIRVFQKCTASYVLDGPEGDLLWQEGSDKETISRSYSEQTQKC